MLRLKAENEEASMAAVNATGFFPVLTTERLIECRDFYVKRFGFKVVFEIDWYVQLLSERGLQLAFLKPNHPSQPGFLHGAYTGDGVVYSFEVEDADQEYLKLKNDKVEILYGITTEEWGQRHYMFRDPGGMIVDVVQTVEPTGEYKAGYEA
jgi:catechol 2,3-dioxygenase-like lactoylglutathione lyase family enzyme